MKLRENCFFKINYQNYLHNMFGQVKRILQIIEGAIPQIVRFSSSIFFQQYILLDNSRLYTYFHVPRLYRLKVTNRSQNQ